MRGELDTEQNCKILTPHSYGHNSVSFLFSTGGLGSSLFGTWSSFQHLLCNWSELQRLNHGSWGPPLLCAGSLYSILYPTYLKFLSLGLYNNLTSTLLPASVTISHSIQPLDSQGYILIFLDQMHLLFTQLHFLFWQLGRVGGQYATHQLPRYYKRQLVLSPVWISSFT